MAAHQETAKGKTEPPEIELDVLGQRPRHRAAAGRDAGDDEDEPKSRSKKNQHTSLFLSAQPSSTSQACSVGPDTSIVDATALSAPTPSHSHEATVISDESDASVIEALADMEDSDGSIYEYFSDEEDVSETASDISLSFLDGNLAPVLGTVSREAESGDDTAGSFSDCSAMSLEEETYFDSDPGAYPITPDTSREAQLRDGDSDFSYRRLWKISTYKPALILKSAEYHLNTEI